MNRELQERIDEISYSLGVLKDLSIIIHNNEVGFAILKQYEKLSNVRSELVYQRG